MFDYNKIFRDFRKNIDIEVVEKYSYLKKDHFDIFTYHGSSMDSYFENDAIIGNYSSKSGIFYFDFSVSSNMNFNIHSIFVPDDLQKKGIGSSIVDVCEKTAKSNSLDVIVHNILDEAIGFWKHKEYEIVDNKFGFKALSTQRKARDFVDLYNMLKR